MISQRGTSSSEILVLVGRKFHTGGILELLVHVLDLILVDRDLRRLKHGGLNEGQVRVTIKFSVRLYLTTLEIISYGPVRARYLPDDLAEKPDEGLFELIVALGGDVVVLKVLLSVESDLLGLNLAVLHVNLVADEHNGDVLAHADEVLVPLGHILVGDTGAHVKHDDGALAADATGRSLVRQLFKN
jgi:hypothetical protein